MVAATGTRTAQSDETALAHRLRGCRDRLPQTGITVVALCIGIALLLTALGSTFVVQLTYSLSIGASCWLLIEGLRLTSAAARDFWRRRRGLPAAGSEFPLAETLATITLGTLGGAALGSSIGHWFVGGSSPELLNLDSPSTRVTLMVTLLATAGLVAVTSARERAFASQARADAAQRQAAQMELRLLQSQLEPHMLFNTLANLRVLIGMDPPRAQDMLDRLIDFLRATLSASRQTQHPLGDEFDRVADYLALMSYRMGPRLRTELTLPADLRDLPVPPLLLQPLVENSIKHGLEPKVGGGMVDVRAAREGRRLILTVRDTGVGLGSGSGGGTRFGLEQVRQRLHTLFGDAAELRLEAVADGGTLATLTLPCPP